MAHPGPADHFAGDHHGRRDVAGGLPRRSRTGGVYGAAGPKALDLARQAFSMLMLVRYGEWALGSYDEVGVGLLARGPGRRFGLHVVHLPVTSARRARTSGVCRSG